MKTKLTLLVDERIKRKARALSKRRKTSISAMISEFIDREDKVKKDALNEFWGIWADRDIDLEKIRERAWRRY
ncbi:MAG: hypothetical protein IPM49_11285 [Flavobacteriales bacterium]|nr:hypothetical protein [Flavobacteriales bacterium]